MWQRLILFVLYAGFTALIMAASAAQAQTPTMPTAPAPKSQITIPIDPSKKITKEMANNFYKNCTRRSPPDQFTDLDVADLCACQAYLLPTQMSVSDLQALSNFTNKANHKALQKYINALVVPCMQGPFSDFVTRSCVESYKHSDRVRNLRATCQCARSKAGKFLNQLGGKMAEARMLLFPEDSSDPATVLMGDSPFRAEIENITYKCIQ